VDKLNIKLGHELTALLLARLQGELPPEPQHRLIKPELRIIDEANSPR
jgi:DNA-binding LacI/PurR family transcriptional regulator